MLSYRLTFLEPIHQPTLALHPHTLNQPSYSNNSCRTQALRFIAPSIAKLHPTRLDSLAPRDTRRAPATFCRNQTRLIRIIALSYVSSGCARLFLGGGLGLEAAAEGLLGRWGIG
jgi:hypothetical protein